MLLEMLTELASLGAEKPLFLSLEKYQEITQKLVPALRDLLADLEDEPKVKENIKRLIAALERKQLRSVHIASGLVALTEVYLGTKDGVKDPLVVSFIERSHKFFEIAKTLEAHRQARQKLKVTMTAEVQFSYDSNLFGLEGVMYCLEYYLVMYKELVEAKDEKMKEAIVSEKEVDLGYGKLPGLAFDFREDDSLSKFIYRIFDDRMRRELTGAYYETKLVFVEKFSLARYGLLIDALKSLIECFFRLFEKMGIDTLKSYFYRPYGDNPKIKDINL